MPVGRFICGIGALIYDERTNRYLLMRRASDKDVGAGTWECPTGRVDQGEGFEEALLREMREELGVTVRPEYLIGTTHFYRGEEKPENELVGLLYGCSVEDPEAIEMSPEHSEMRWVTLREIYGFLPVDHWLIWVVERAEKVRNAQPAVLTDLFRREGFEAR